jgi:fermentation-respiration switch protein FrsA (DUF1100 family)
LEPELLRLVHRRGNSRKGQSIHSEATGTHPQPFIPALNGRVFGLKNDNLQKISHVTCPIFMAHGTVDNLVPPKMLSELASAAGRNVVIYKVAGGGHNDVFDVGGDALWGAIGASIFEP